MNAIVGLCHFCDAHGPSSIFCTETLRDTNVDDLNVEIPMHPDYNCSICNSIGYTTGIVSEDPENNVKFLSTQIPIVGETRSLMKMASLRSLTDEGNYFKDGLFFFGNSEHGYVISTCFQLSDLQARGFHQLFSIVVLMKDRSFLLNIKRFLAEHLKKISEELKSKAKIVYDLEQKERSGRNRCLSGGENSVQSPRSLVELLNDKNVFYSLHTHFTWILLAGSRFLTEKMTFYNVPWLTLQLNKKSIQSTSKALGDNSTVSADANTPRSVFFRHLKNVLGSEFIPACYCALTGTKIVIRGPSNSTYNILQCFRKMLPREMHKLTYAECPQFLTHPDGKIVTVSPEIAVPMPTNKIFRIDILNEDTVSVKWHASVPEKIPQLLKEIIRITNEDIITDAVLDKHLSVVVERWKNKVIWMNGSPFPNGFLRARRILGIQRQDIPLATYWKTYL